MKTADYWFRYLTSEEEERFIKNFSHPWDINLGHFESLEEFIGCSFIWDDTPEGNDYWYRISLRERRIGFVIKKFNSRYEFH